MQAIDSIQTLDRITAVQFGLQSEAKPAPPKRFSFPAVFLFLERSFLNTQLTNINKSHMWFSNKIIIISLFHVTNTSRRNKNDLKFIVVLASQGCVFNITT